MSFIVAPDEYTRRSIYMRLASAAYRDEWWYPVRLCDETHLSELIALDHVTTQGDFVKLTKRGLCWWATEVCGLLYSKRGQRTGQIIWLSQWIEDKDMNLKEAHIKLLRQLDAARSASQSSVKGEKLSKWGLSQLVKEGLVTAYANGNYAITGEGVALLRRMEAPQPVENNDGKGEQPEPVLDTKTSCNGCDSCIYQQVITVLAERVPGLHELGQLIRQKMEIERGISTLLDKVGHS